MIMIAAHTIPQTVPVIELSFTYSLASLIRFAPTILPMNTENDIANAIGITWKIETMLMQMCYAAITEGSMKSITMTENIW